jgi:hypothetical protein
MLGRRKHPDAIDRRRSLASVPVLNEALTWEKADDGRLTLVIEFKRGKGFLDRFKPPIMRRKVRLDELGQFVFEHVDGRRDVKSIIDAFADRYRTDRREAELSVAEFLKSLAQRHVISLIVE